MLSEIVLFLKRKPTSGIGAETDNTYCFPVDRRSLSGIEKEVKIMAADPLRCGQSMESLLDRARQAERGPG